MVDTIGNESGWGFLTILVSTKKYIKNIKYTI